MVFLSDEINSYFGKDNFHLFFLFMGPKIFCSCEKSSENLRAVNVKKVTSQILNEQQICLLFRIMENTDVKTDLFCVKLSTSVLLEGIHFERVCFRKFGR